MSRWIPVLITLLAQVVAMASPACFVRCTGVDGHVCLELAGQSCHCCEMATDVDDEHDGKPLAGCCAGHKYHQHESQDRCSTIVLSRCDDCGCQHSMIESSLAVARKSISQTLESQRIADFATVLTACFSPDSLDVSPQVGFQDCPLRPHVSAHLTLLSMVVLRV